MKITDLRFNSRSLCGERSERNNLWLLPVSFQFSLPVRGAYRKLYKERTCSNVSILAPCAGSVCKADNGNCQYQHVSILAPCAGSVSKNSSVYPITTPLFHLRTAYLRCESPNSMFTATSHHIGLPEQASKLQNLCLGVSSPFSQFLPDNQRLSNGNSRTLLKMRFLHQPLDQFQRAIDST